MDTLKYSQKSLLFCRGNCTKHLFFVILVNLFFGVRFWQVSILFGCNVETSGPSTPVSTCPWVTLSLLPYHVFRKCHSVSILLLSNRF